MKIGVVCYPTYGGSGVIATELGIALANNGHEVHFITYRRPARLTRFHENVFYHEVSTEADYALFEYSPYESSLTSKLVDVATFEDLELLHVHYAIPHAVVAHLAQEILKESGRYVPIVTTLHGTDITLVGKNKAFAPVVSYSINQSDGVTAVSEYLKEETMRNFDIKDDIKVIPNFIDLARFKKADKDHFKKAIAPDGEKILTHVSNFRKVKRVEDVIHVFKNVYEKIPSKLMLIGDGPERQKLEELCRQIGLCHEVRFLGKQDAIEELLAVSDLFIMPSASESFGLAALEAMACEVPVISSNAGGLPEVNIHGQTGFLCEIGDIEALSNHSISLLTNPELHAKFKQNALNQAKRFHIDSIIPEYENFYESILAKSTMTV